MHFRPIRYTPPFTRRAPALLLALGMLAASAQAESAYVGVSLGSQNYPNLLNGVSTSGSALSGDLFGGYQFNDNVALELGLVELGSINNAAGRIDSYGAYLDAIGIIPLSYNWSLSGRLGAAFMNVNTPPGNDTGTGVKLGLGAEYAVSRTLSIGTEWDRYQLNVFGATPYADQLTVGIKFRY